MSAPLLCLLLALQSGPSAPPSLSAQLEGLAAQAPVAEAPGPGPQPGHLALLWGGFALAEDEPFYEFGGEWRLPDLGSGLAPIAGLTFFEGGSTYLYGGLRWELDLGRRFFLAPSFAAGLYDENDGFSLGGPLEFRSALEVGWRWRRSVSISLAFYHLSNASLYEENDGSESLVLSLAWDLAELWQ